MELLAVSGRETSNLVLKMDHTTTVCSALIRCHYRPILIAFALLCHQSGSGGLGAQELHRHLLVDGSRQELSTIGAIVPLGGGHLAIGQPLDWRIVLTDSGRSSLRTVGRRGEGPGEFGAISGVGLHPGGFWVADRPRRITLFDGDGHIVKIRPWPRIDGLAGLPPIGLASILGWPASGTMVLLAAIRPLPANPGDSRPTPPGEILIAVDTVGTGSLLARLAPRRPCPVRGNINSPFCPTSLRSVSPNGEWIVVVDPGAEDQSGIPVRVSLFRSSGASAYSRVYRFPTRRVSGADVDSVVERRGGLPGTRKEYLDAIRRGPHPTWMPSVSSAVVTNDGQVWIEVASRDRSTSSWRVLSTAGADSSRVAFPRNFSLRAVDADRAVGVESTELGTENVVEYLWESP